MITKTTEVIKESWRTNKRYWVISMIALFVMIGVFAYKLKDAMLILLTWTFATSSHKILEDIGKKDVMPEQIDG